MLAQCFCWHCAPKSTTLQRCDAVQKLLDIYKRQTNLNHFFNTLLFRVGIMWSKSTPLCLPFITIEKLWTTRGKSEMERKQSARHVSSLHFTNIFRVFGQKKCCLSLWVFPPAQCCYVALSMLMFPASKLNSGVNSKIWIVFLAHTGRSCFRGRIRHSLESSPVKCCPWERGDDDISVVL